MKQSKIIQAYELTDKLGEQTNISNKGKWVLFKLRKDLLPAYEFNRERYVELYKKHNGTTDGDKIKFETPEIAQAFVDDLNELADLDTELDFSKQELSLNDIPDITVHEIEILDDFITFTE